MRMALALVPVMGWRIASLGIANAFLHGQELGEGATAGVLADSKGVVWRAKKCVYGLADGACPGPGKWSSLEGAPSARS